MWVGPRGRLHILPIRPLSQKAVTWYYRRDMLRYSLAKWETGPTLFAMIVCYAVPQRDAMVEYTDSTIRNQEDG